MNVTGPSSACGKRAFFMYRILSTRKSTYRWGRTPTNAFQVQSHEHPQTQSHKHTPSSLTNALQRQSHKHIPRAVPQKRSTHSPKHIVNVIPQAHPKRSPNIPVVMLQTQCHRYTPNAISTIDAPNAVPSTQWFVWFVSCTV